MSDESLNEDILDPSSESSNEEPKVTLTQRQLNDKIRFARKEGKESVEKALRNREDHSSPSQNHSNDSDSRLTREEIIKIANEARDEERRSDAALNIAKTFLNKVEVDKVNVPDYDKEVTHEFYAEYPNLVTLAVATDNTASVMLELKRNPAMRTTLQSALLNGDHKGAAQIIGELSARLKKNKEAENVSRASEPGFKANSSKIALENGSPKTVSDWRLKYSRQR